MKIKSGIRISICAAVFFLCAAGRIKVLAAQRDLVSGPGVSIDVSNLRAAKDSEQLLITEGAEGSEAVVSYYRKENGKWNCTFSVKTQYGRNGASSEKKEGDGKTPEGIYQFSKAFGIKDNPGTTLEYHKTLPGDVWVDDSESIYYNTMENSSEVTKDWKSAEDLYTAAPYYNYVLALDYNKEAVPGKGSAIFLHCNNPGYADTGSAGCIRLPEEYMITILKTMGSNAKIIIVSDSSELAQY